MLTPRFTPKILGREVHGLFNISWICELRTKTLITSEFQRNFSELGRLCFFVQRYLNSIFVDKDTFLDAESSL